MALFLDSVTEPVNFNPQSAPFDLLVSDLWGKLETVNSENKGPFPTISAKKVNIIEAFVKTWRTHFGNNIYPAVRLTFPNRDGRKYFIKNVALVQLVSRLLRLPKGLADYTIIRNWKKSYHYKARLVGAAGHAAVTDLPLIISRIVLRRRDQNVVVKSTVSVDDVNKILDTLAKTTQADAQAELLRPFMEKLTISEVRYLFQIILKDSILSFFERSFFVTWHPDAYELYKVCSDMKKIFWALADPETRLTRDQLCVQLMHQLVPQSSKKLEVSYEALCKRMAAKMNRAEKDPVLLRDYDDMHIEGHFLIEEKVDGDRMLMHKNEGAFLWHTRRRRDYTMVYGENFHVGSLTKHLQYAFHPVVKSIVLDGEMVAWSEDQHALLPFGTLRLAAIQEAVQKFNTVDVYEGNNAWPFFLIFDILHLNGHDLSYLPLFYRKKLLRQVVNDVPHRFELLKWVKAAHASDLKTNMQRIVSENNEGIMVKSLLLNYRVYSRDSTWVKVKPEYLENFGENLDLVVIGKVGKIKTSYMCGLRDDDNEGTYKLFCSVANGFLRAVYRTIESKLCNHWVDYAARKPPNELMEFGTKKPDYWINPANLVVFEIKARSIEVTADTPYAAGSTLHNLWCRAVRDDKSYDECISLQQYQQLKARYSLDVYKPQAVNRDLKRLRQDSLYGVFSRRKVAGTEDYGKSSLFENLHYVIVNDYETAPRTISQREIELIVKNHGGETHLHPKKDDLQGKVILVISDQVTPRLERWLEEGFDIISPRWVFESLQNKKLLAIEPQFVTASNNAPLKTAMQARVDQFGDSYTATAPTLARLLRDLLGYRMTKSLSPSRLHQEMQELTHGGLRGLTSLFEGCVMCVVGESMGKDVEDPHASAACKTRRKILRFGGGTTENPWTAGCTCGYVIVPHVPSSNLYDGTVKLLLKELATRFDEHAKMPYIVTEEFIDASVQAGVLVDPEPYLWK
ncbi:ATP-dependent DNA ligase [Metschnikowia bicuspidata]|uniref:DNA ligase 4 n=1 Tax=Metschnikowia bicuspidata TaxID=27322 RepID=A0A4P9ZCU8_9ASCO|nr:ATP-dependent DNA ligase [Metschnikowia bicuspidata]